MNVGRFNTGGGNYENLPLLDSRAFNREKDSKGFVVAKILAAREIKSKKKSRWEGLALDIKAKSGTKYSFLMKTGDKSGQVDSYDIGAICQQTNSEETDDWIGESIKFVSKKGKTGGVFVNVFRPTSKKGKK